MSSLYPQQAPGLACKHQASLEGLAKGRHFRYFTDSLVVKKKKGL
jgi:hypothetical protein